MAVELPSYVIYTLTSPYSSLRSSRSKLTPHYDRPRKKDGKWEIGAIGFQMKGQRRLIDVGRCVIGTDAINQKMEEKRREVRERGERGELKRMNRGATLLFRDSGGGVVTDHNEYVTETVKSEVGGEVKFRFKAGNFFQNNPHMIGTMVDYVVGWAVGDRGGKKGKYLIDTYCGSGLFALSAGGR